jgi:hypothetical protein
LDEAKREVDDRNEKIYIMEATVNTIAKVSLEMLECRKLARVYALFLKEKWHKNQIVNLAQLVRYNLDTPKYFLDSYQYCNMEEKERMCDFYLHNIILPHPYKWNPNPYVGDVHMMTFASWLRHKDMREE